MRELPTCERRRSALLFRDTDLFAGGEFGGKSGDLRGLSGTKSLMVNVTY
jgi:hypothetical protein